MIAVKSLGRAKLSELCKLVTDGTHDTPKIVSQGVPLIKGKDISSGRVDFSVCDLISIEDHKQIIKRSKPERGDTLFANIGNSLGDVAYVETDQEFSIKNVALFKPNSAVTIPRYLFYLLKSPVVQSGLLSQRSGAAQPFLGLAALRGFEVDYHHDLETQRRIASILGAYDDLIEVNRRRVAILEEMARGLFEEWFVHFRFPGHDSVPMVKSASMSAPQGWSVVPFGDLLSRSTGGLWGEPFATDTCHLRATVIRGTDFPKILSGQYGSVPDRFVSERELLVRHLCPGDIVLEASGGSKDQPVGRALFMTASLIAQLKAPVAPASFCKLLRATNLPGLNYFIFGLLSAMYLDGRIEKFQKQSTGLRNFSIRQLASEHVLCPSSSVLASYESAVAPIVDLTSILRHETSALAASRDLLLPRLISGQLSVEAAERELEAAA